MNHYLLISALGNDRPGIVKELSKTILDLGGNISESRMSVLGGEFAVILLISGQQEQLTAIEKKLSSLQQQLALTIICKATTSRPSNTQRVPYIAQIIALDHPGIVHEVTDFFTQNNINIEELTTETYPAAHTGTPMFSLEVVISIPSETMIVQLRDDFVSFCDQLNLDATLEPLQ